MTKKVEKKEVVIRFSGDSGDGMQLSGTIFSDTSAIVGNSIATFPDYPAEIRAPQGTVGGVSGFQVHVGSCDVLTPGDYCDLLIAMNPAALKANKRWLEKGGTVIVDIDAFTEKNIEKAGYKTLDPITEEGLDRARVIEAPISSMTKTALESTGLDSKAALKCKNMFALGIAFWLYDRPLELADKHFDKKFGKKKPEIAAANKLAVKAGYDFAANTHAFANNYFIDKADIKPGRYRSLNGNVLTAWGLMAAAEKSGLQLFCGSYPITPATVILEELAAQKSLGVKTLQCEDEIAGICTAIGAAFAGSFAVTTTSGPGLCLKSEAINLAIMAELPLVIVNVQRGGPSTGLPTKTEQSDLLQALYGRNGESPIIVIAAKSPADCFDMAFEAGKLTLESMTPVILLTDGFIANGTEPWRIPEMKDMPTITPRIAKEGEPYLPYKRDEETLARSWAFPGMEGMEHRIGGLEKMKDTGTISYIPENHEYMVEVRAEKVARVKVPDIKVEGAQEGDILVVGWGGTYGHLKTAVSNLNAEGVKIGLAHFNYINPLPKNTAEIFSKFKKIVVCEINSGQFASYLRSTHQQFDYLQYNKIMGLPFTVVELEAEFNKIIKS